MDVDRDTLKAIEKALAEGRAVETGRVLAFPVPPPPGALPAGLSEREFQKAVIDLARDKGWLVAHFAPARVLRRGKEVYETPVRADGKGFPDLVLVKGDWLIFAELKTDKGRVGEDQAKWVDALRAVPGIDAGVWRPAQWDQIVRTLTGAG